MDSYAYGNSPDSTKKTIMPHDEKKTICMFYVISTHLRFRHPTQGDLHEVHKND